MSSHIPLDSPFQKLPEVAKDAIEHLPSNVEEGLERTKGFAKQAVDATKDVAHRASDSAKEMYHSAAIKAEDALATSREYVNRNPMKFVLGSVAFGVAVGYLIMCSRRKPTFRERFAEEPLGSVREAILTALAPVGQRVHDGYDSAREGVGKVMDEVHRFRPSHRDHSMSDRISRVASNLKFW